VQRRKFLQVSGLSAASFLFARIDPVTGNQFKTMRFPDAVSVRCGGEWISLAGTNENWKFEELQVSFQLNGEAVSVSVSSPKRALEFVKCSWKQVFGATSKFLSDQWERSYGDLGWEATVPPVSMPASQVPASPQPIAATPALPPAAKKSPWYLLISDGVLTQAYGVKTGANSFCYWQISTETLDLFLDTNSGGEGVLLGERTLHAADIISTESLNGENPWHTDIRFCKMMCPTPRLPAKPVYGINDWYFAYGNNSRDLILEHTKTMSALAPDPSNPPFSVIDMGWSVKPEKTEAEYCWGDDFTQGNDKFGDMSIIASEIKALGMRPGIWTRPLLANAKDKPSSLIPIRQDQKDLKERYIDPTIPENLQRIGNTIRLYEAWGYHLVKHDYTSYDFFGRWGFEMNETMTVSGWHFNDRSITNAEIILFLYRTLRAASLDMYLIGCNTFSHLSAGIFELNRIGDDTSGKEWARTLKMGVNTLGFRLPQHNVFYAVDGDCVGLTTSIPWAKNKQWLRLLAESSAPLFISAAPDALGAEQKDYIRKAFTAAAKVQPLAQPLDWMTNPRPEQWILNGERVTFYWD
jgi:alpha-galactosidase